MLGLWAAMVALMKASALQKTVERTQSSVAPIPVHILRLEDLPPIVGLATATIWMQVKAGSFPAPVRLTGQPDKAGALGWRSDQIADWITSRPLAITGFATEAAKVARRAGAEAARAERERAAAKTARKAKATASEVRA